MHATNRNLLLLTAAVAQGSTGLGLLLLPALLFSILLGMERVSAEAIFVGRIAGAALLAIGIASWMARPDGRSPAQNGLLAGLLTYNSVATVLLAYAGAVLSMTGVALWPAVALHAVLTVWSLRCMRGNSHTSGSS